MIGTPSIMFGGGWQTGDPDAIRKKFGATPGVATPAPGFPAAGAPGDAGMLGSAANPALAMQSPLAPPPISAIDDSTTVAKMPAQNAMQRQQAEAATPPAMRPISNARRFFWGTGLVDASAPLSPRSAPTDFDATFGAGAPHMGGPGVTWQQRQQQNQQKVADATAQRGLDWSPY